MSTRRKLRASRAKNTPSIQSTPKVRPLNAETKLKMPSTPDATGHAFEDPPSSSEEHSSALLLGDADKASNRSDIIGKEPSRTQPEIPTPGDNQMATQAQALSAITSLPLPSHAPLSLNFVAQLRQFVPSGPLMPFMSQKGNILHNGYVFSLFECSIICSLRMFVKNTDGSFVDDNTAAEVLKAMRDHRSAVDCRGVHRKIVLKGPLGNQDKDGWATQVYNDIQNRSKVWSSAAQLYWWAWMAQMNDICRR